MIEKNEYLNLRTENEMRIEGYSLSKSKLMLTRLMIVLSLGFLKLVLYWRSDLMLKFTHKRCDLKKATKVLLVDKYNQKFVESIQYLLNIDHKVNEESKEESNSLLESNRIKYFTNKKLKYVWNHRNEVFEKLKGLEDNYTFEYFQKHTGLTKDEENAKLSLYGENSINVSITPLSTLLIKEVLSPFYIFQIFSCALWYFETYVYFATCIVVISAVSIIYSLHSIRRNEKALRNMIHNVNQVNILRKKNKSDYEEVTINSNFLVPGHIIEIKNMTIMQCDALLLEDSTVVVNESMLTGESVPITKTGIGFSDSNGSKLNFKEHKKHILFSGTQVMQTRLFSSDKVKAIVLRTGFDTSKGELIRAILFPKPSEFRFDLDLYKYIGALTLISILGMIYTVLIMNARKNSLLEIILRSLDLITIVVPPALPGALTACLIYAQNRLKKNKIYCISPNRINVCGSIDVFVFDKTGTLTEDDCDIKFILPTNQEKNSSFTHEIRTVNALQDQSILEILATCHSISKLDNALAGDPLDLKLFEFTKWIYFENENDDASYPVEIYPKYNINHKIGIVKQFPFSSTLQRMSVIVKCSNRDSFDFLSKGSPEMIASQCKSDTIPFNFTSILNEYSSKGYRIIALASKAIDTNLYDNVNEIERSVLEKDMRFLGLVVMENKLKKETSQVINQLNVANVRSIMCTGDNLLTALNVGIECGMLSNRDNIIEIEIDNKGDLFFKQEIFNSFQQSFTNNENLKTSYIITGHSFEIIRKKHPEIMGKLIENGKIFARMSPEQKQQLIEELQTHKGYFVGMCGDGANDCGALKAANAGISLSEAEASIASPFTSKIPNIECTVNLIREGRCALVTSFGLVKFICMYSLTNFISVILLYSIGYLLSDSEFLYIDMGLVTFIAFFFSQTEAFPFLDTKAPTNKLIALRPIGSLAFHTLLTFGIQFFAMYYSQIQPWYERFCEEMYMKGYLGPYENSAVFIVSLFQYITAGVIFSKGVPYRKNIFSNKFLFIFLVLATLVNIFLGLNSFKFVTKIIVMRFIPDFKFRLVIIGLAVIHFFISYLFESFFFDDVYALL